MNGLAAVTACTADFTIGTTALLRTLKRHHPDVQRICYTLPEQVEALKSTLGELAEVRAIPRVLKHAPSDPKILASWARVFIPTIDSDTVAWFDSDVIVVRPAPEWWQVPAGKINAVHDRAYRIRHMVPHGMEGWYFNRFTLNPEAHGFNAGIFALRPAEHAELTEQFEQLLGEQDMSRLPFAFDQGLLNGLLLAKANILPSAFNAHCLGECGVPRDVRCIHYTGSPKPWAKGYDRATMGYFHWLRDGEERKQLGILKLRVLASQPRRLSYKACRKLLSKLGLWNDEMGVGTKPGVT